MPYESSESKPPTVSTRPHPWFAARRAQVEAERPASRPKQSRLFTLRELRALPPPEWLIAPILPKAGLCVLFGPPKRGKTFVALDMALKRAAAGDLVVYIAGEGTSGIRQRLDAWLTEHGRPDDPLPTFLLHAGAVAMFSKSAVDDFVRSMGDRRPILVVIDTLARNFAGGDENNAKDMGEFVAHCDRIKDAWACTVLVLHHTGKNEKKGARGSNALLGAVDCEMELEDLKNGRVLLKCTNMKDAAPFAPVCMELVPCHGSCIVREAPIGGITVSTTPRKRALKGETDILAALVEGPLRFSELKARISGSERTLTNRLNGLKAAGKIVQEDGKWRLVSSSEPGPQQKPQAL